MLGLEFEFRVRIKVRGCGYLDCGCCSLMWHRKSLSTTLKKI